MRPVYVSFVVICPKVGISGPHGCQVDAKRSAVSFVKLLSVV